MLMFRLGRAILWLGLNLILVLYLVSAFRVRVPVLCFPSDIRGQPLDQPSEAGR